VAGQPGVGVQADRAAVRRTGFWIDRPVRRGLDAEPVAGHRLAVQRAAVLAQPELLPLRALSLLEGLGLLAVNYWTANRLGGKPIAIISTLLLSLTRIFFHTAHMARYDILATLFGYMALMVVVNDQRGRFWAGLAAGLLGGLAVESHLNSVIFFPAMALYYLIEYRGAILRRASSWGFALGSVLGAGSTCTCTCCNIQRLI